MIKGESYMVVGFPYQLPVYEGYYPEEQIREEMQEDDFDSIAWSMEMDSLFFGSSEKAFYNFETVDKIRKIQRALYPKPYYALLNDSKYKYEPKRNGEIRLLSMDIATQGGSKNDATCFTLMQLLPTSSNQYIRNVLYITTLDGGHTFDQALKARRLFEDFDCDYIIVDTNGVGIGVFDNLVIEQVDDERNTVYPAWSCINDDKMAERCKDPEAEKVIYSIKATAKFNSDAAVYLRDCIKRGKLRLLINEMAFNLRYFDQFNDRELKARLQAMPKEIRDGYNQNKGSINNWIILDDTKTIVTKVNAAINQPWGVPMAVTAFDDIMYAEYFVNTKRTVLDSINNQIIYMTFPEGKEKGTSSLTKDQQREQHEKVKEAVITRRSQSGISFFSLASGTKIDKMDVDIDIFDEKNEASIKDAVPGALGISSASLDGNTKGNYATASLNLELVASNTYTWIENFMFELNKCINANIIMDSSCVVDCYILPTTFANRDKQVKYMQDLYSHGKGSLTAWVSATGFDPDAYISLLDYELESDFENKYPVHATSFTMSGRDEADSKESGREAVDFATNENTIQSQSSGSNTNPKPSTD